MLHGGLFVQLLDSLDVRIFAGILLRFDIAVKQPPGIATIGLGCKGFWKRSIAKYCSEIPCLVNPE